MTPAKLSPKRALDCGKPPLVIHKLFAPFRSAKTARIVSDSGRRRGSYHHFHRSMMVMEYGWARRFCDFFTSEPARTVRTTVHTSAKMRYGLGSPAQPPKSDVPQLRLRGRRRLGWDLRLFRLRRRRGPERRRRAQAPGRPDQGREKGGGAPALLGYSPAPRALTQRGGA